jgi:hypothetical protein
MLHLEATTFVACDERERIRRSPQRPLVALFPLCRLALASLDFTRQGYASIRSPLLR